MFKIYFLVFVFINSPLIVLAKAKQRRPSTEEFVLLSGSLSRGQYKILKVDVDDRTCLVAMGTNAAGDGGSGVHSNCWKKSGEATK